MPSFGTLKVAFGSGLQAGDHRVVAAADVS